MKIPRIWRSARRGPILAVIGLVLLVVVAVVFGRSSGKPESAPPRLVALRPIEVNSFRIEVHSTSPRHILGTDETVVFQKPGRWKAEWRGYPIRNTRHSLFD